MKPSPDHQRPGTATRSIILGTAGHIDHGKTALVFALTGTDTDRLPEEKSRGITIDLGFAAMRLQDEMDRALELSLIDVPGHHAFVRNMLAGAGGIDCVMLVIAADEGVKPQTEEHLVICALLGIRRGITVLTKKDAVSPERLQQARAEVKRFLEHTFLADDPVVAVSTLTREGLPELKVELARLASQIPERSTDFVPRLPLDRAFSVRGFGTVVTGTLQSGVLRAGEMLTLQPQQRPVRVRGVQVHGKARAQADAPCRVALNLAGVDLAEIKRGDTLVSPETLASVSTLDVEITMLPGAPVLKHRASVRVHAFTADTSATVLLYDAEPTTALNTTFARIRLARPMLLIPGDRLVLRQNSPALTIGGGRVLDAHPLPRLRKTSSQRWLEELIGATPSQQMLLRVLRRGVAGISAGQLVAETGLTKEALHQIALPAIAEGRLIGTAASRSLPDHLLSAQFLTEAAEITRTELGRAKGNSILRAELQSKTRLNEWVFELAVNSLLQARRIESNRAFLSLPGQGTGASTAVAQRLAQVEELYRNAGLSSPIVSEAGARLGVAPEELHPLITALLRSKKLVRMGADNLLIHADVLARLADDLRKHRGERFDVARFKSFTGLTRKHAIPLLEHLDGARITRNVQGTRIVL